MRGRLGQVLAVFMGAVAIALLGWMSFQEIPACARLKAVESPLAPRSLSEKLQEPYRFVAFGDWGAGTPFQRDVASQLALALEKNPYDAALLLGDNIYPDGNIQNFGKAYFTDMYGALIHQHVHFVVALGNHDIVGGYQADQLSFFKMPGYYYSVKKPGLEFFVIDTNHFAKDKVQQQWLKQALSASTSSWKVVLGHHPVYSSGEHGSNQRLKLSLEPLLIAHKVNLYLAGHDHNYERFKPVHGVQYIVSGGGGAYLRNFNKPLPHSLIRLKAHHFLDFELKGNQLKMHAVDKTGRIIDQAQWIKPALLPLENQHKQAS